MDLKTATRNLFQNQRWDFFCKVSQALCSMENTTTVEQGNKLSNNSANLKSIDSSKPEFTFSTRPGKQFPNFGVIVFSLQTSFRYIMFSFTDISLPSLFLSAARAGE